MSKQLTEQTYFADIIIILNIKTNINFIKYKNQFKC